MAYFILNLTYLKEHVFALRLICILLYNIIILEPSTVSFMIYDYDYIIWYVADM